MSRNLRQDPIDGLHHVTNHAVGSQQLYLNDRDRCEFIRRMGQAEQKFDVTVIAYVLMGNHFHLVLHCPDQGLSAFMHFLESVYAREFNMRHARRGALFQSEFYNELIRSDGQAAATVRYVHRNPLELGIAIRTYPWSSYLAYVDNTYVATGGLPAIVTDLLGSPSQHRTYVETDADSDSVKMATGVRRVYRSAPEVIDVAIADLCSIAAEICAVTVPEIVAPRARARNDARQAVSLVAYESRVGFREELRVLLGYQSGAGLRTAVKRARRRCNSDDQFGALVGRVRERWTSFDRAMAS